MNDIRREIRDLRKGMSGLFRIPFESAFVPIFDFDTEEKLSCGGCSEAWEDKESMSISFDLPGFEKEDITVSFSDGRLVLSAKKIRVDPVVKDRVVLVKRDASVKHEMFLPSGLDVERARAEYRNGVLTVVLPKVEKSRTRSVNIE